MTAWIDIEQQRPEHNQRVICLFPFGIRVEDDTWTDDHGFMNTREYVSHWMPINPPGTYTEIMQRPRGEKPLPIPAPQKHLRDVFSESICEHMRMMDSLIITQLNIRFEAKAAEKKTEQF